MIELPKNSVTAANRNLSHESRCTNEEYQTHSTDGSYCLAVDDGFDEDEGIGKENKQNSKQTLE